MLQNALTSSSHNQPTNKGTKIPGIEAIVLVIAIRVPAKLGDKSMWFDKKPQYIPPMPVTDIVINITAIVGSVMTHRAAKQQQGTTLATAVAIFLPIVVDIIPLIRMMSIHFPRTKLQKRKNAEREKKYSN